MHLSIGLILQQLDTMVIGTLSISFSWVFVYSRFVCGIQWELHVQGGYRILPNVRERYCMKYSLQYCFALNGLECYPNWKSLE